MKIAWIISAVVLLVACERVKQPTEKTLKPLASASGVVVENDKFGITDSGLDLVSRSDVQRFINQELKLGYYTQPQLDNFFKNVQFKPSIIKGMDRPGTSLPWYTFAQNNANSLRIKNGKSFWKNNAAVLKAVSKRYGVAPELLVAIIGIETNYGHTTGSFRVADVLTTLGYHYPRRAAYFQRELVEFLQLAYEEKRDPFSFKGSFAGAMGMPQFMPSSYRQYAVDWDGDGQRDIWNNIGDTLASVANYMKQHGWKTDQPIAVSVSLQITPQIQQIIDQPTEMKYSAGQLRQLGIVIPAHINDQEKGILYQLERMPGKYEYWFGLNNFYTIWQYNHSRHYVAAVRQIANSINDGSTNL